MQATKTHKRHTKDLITFYVHFVSFCGLVSGCGSSSAYADGTPIVFAVSARECLIHARFDIALGLSTNRCQLRHYQIA